MILSKLASNGGKNHKWYFVLLPASKFWKKIELRSFLNDNTYCFPYHSTKKRQHYFDILKAFFFRHSSEYENVR